MGLIEDLFFVGGRAGMPFDADTRGISVRAQSETRPVAALVTRQTVASFPVAAIAITLIWRFCAAQGWDGRAVPMVAAAVLGVLLYVASLRSTRPRSLGQWVSGALLATANSLFLGISVWGIDIAIEVTNVADALASR